MKKKRMISDIYEEYKNSDDKTTIINGVIFYKIINKTKLARYELIVLPNEVFGNGGNVLEDERGNVFKVGYPAHFSFRGEIPVWYLETVTLMLQDIKLEKIGEYVRVISEKDSRG